MFSLPQESFIWEQTSSPTTTTISYNRASFTQTQTTNQYLLEHIRHCSHLRGIPSTNILIECVSRTVDLFVMETNGGEFSFECVSLFPLPQESFIWEQTSSPTTTISYNSPFCTQTQTTNKYLLEHTLHCSHLGSIPSTNVLIECVSPTVDLFVMNTNGSEFSFQCVSLFSLPQESFIWEQTPSPTTTISYNRASYTQTQTTNQYLHEHILHCGHL